MMIKSDELIEELEILVKQHILYATEFLKLSENELQYRNNDKSWSILECIEHLNLYGNFYLTEIEKRMKSSKKNQETYFKSGWLGNKFALDMLPKDDMKVMSTFKSKNPIHSTLNREKVLLNFIKQQKEMLILLKLAKGKSLNKIKTSITLPILKFRLGDTFRFVIYHNERHLKQAKNILNNLV